MRSTRDGEARAAAEPRWSLKPHQQIAIIWVAALLALAIVVALTIVRLGAVESSYRRVAGRAVPIAQALTEAQALYQSNIAGSSALLRPQTDAQRIASISDLTAKTRNADAAWATYKRLAGGASADQALQHTAEAAEAEQIRLVTPALSGRTFPAGTADRLTQAGAAQIAAIDALRVRYSGNEIAALSSLATVIDRGRRDVVITSGIELTLLLLGFGAVFGSVRRRDRQVRASELQRAADADRNDLETRLTRSLEMVHAEDSVYPRVKRAIFEVAANRSAETLVATSSRSRLRQIIALGAAADGGGCLVGDPRDCPAIARGQTQVFAHSSALDACPFLADRKSGACSAACVPLSIGGKTIGVVHVTAAPGAAPDPETVARLEIIARKAGDRIGMLRAFSRSETEAHTDQLTGLLNRRSLEDEVHRIADSGQAYTVAYGDLDHFKQVNDVYGHDAGDRALRVFARVLRDSVRPNDIPARYGGEEFVVVLPECSIADATQVLERVRENLARAQATAASPPVTVSFGLASSGAGTRFDDVLKLADGALAEAKELGRDRIIASSAGLSAERS
ncbi:MAG TPA: sensor domain-containing diguanylate cyclase [Acidimicrobiia bacterium]